MSRSGRYAFLALSVLFVLSVLEQAFLAGLGLFRSAGVWEIHVGIGHMVVFVPFAMLLVSWVFHLGRRSVQYAGLLLLGTVVQTSVFAALREAAPVLAAFHPVLAVLLFAGGGLVVWHARGHPDARAPALASANDASFAAGV
ncbi:MAG: DUF6220 domain-containing protein [Thermoleophilia bacterium]